LLADFSEESFHEEDPFMSLIIDAIKKAQQLRLKDLKGAPFFKGPDPRRDKRRMERRHLWALAAVGFCLLLILLGGLSYSRWKSQASQPPVSVVNAPTQEVAKDYSQGLRKEEASASRTEWPSLWEKYETDETWGDVLKKPKAKKKKKTKTKVSIESENDKIQNPLTPEDETPVKPTGLEREARIDKRQTPSAPLLAAPPLPAAPLPPVEPPLPDQGIQKPAPALPKQEALVKPKNSELETGKNQTAASDALIHFNSGVDLYHQRDYAKAIQAYQKVIELDPGYAEAHNNLGIIYQEAGDFERALSSYQKAIEINPKYEKALNNLGVLLYLKGRYEESIQAFQKALALNANNIESHINLGILFKKQGQVDQAIESYHRALAINPLHGEAHYNMGLLYEQLGKMEMAIDHYQKFIQMASKTHPDLVAQVKRHLNYLTMTKKDE
jgi:type IV pilus biogenesis/stability protein PilW